MRSIIPESGWLASPNKTTLSQAVSFCSLGPANAENSFHCPSGTSDNASLTLGSYSLTMHQYLAQFDKVSLDEKANREMRLDPLICGRDSPAKSFIFHGGRIDDVSGSDLEHAPFSVQLFRIIDFREIYMACWAMPP